MLGTAAIAVASIALALTYGAQAQTNMARRPSVGTVTFTRSLTNGNPAYYSLAIDSMGTATYKSFPNSDQKTGQPYTKEFPASLETRTRVFRLAQALNFFLGSFQIGHSSVLSSPTMSLTYSVDTTKRQIQYTSSQDRRINELTLLFQKIAATLDCGRTLQRLRTGHPVQLEQELSQMKVQSDDGGFLEVQVIAPVLRSIAADSSVSAVSRGYARDILERAQLRPAAEVGSFTFPAKGNPRT
jgi:hypothetical protein